MSPSLIAHGLGSTPMTVPAGLTACASGQAEARTAGDRVLIQIKGWPTPRCHIRVGAGDGRDNAANTRDRG